MQGRARRPALLFAALFMNFLFSRCWMLAFTALLLACSPALNWREFVSAEGQFSAVFPGKPKVSTREVFFGNTRVPMSMSVAGQGPALFAVGVATLPAGFEPEVLPLLQQALLTNTGMQLMVQESAPAALPAAVVARARQHVALRAQRDTTAGTDTGPTQLSAHLLIVDHRAYQIVALGDAQLKPDDLETFFGAFKLTP